MGRACPSQTIPIPKGIMAEHGEGHAALSDAMLHILQKKQGMLAKAPRAAAAHQEEELQLARQQVMQAVKDGTWDARARFKGSSPCCSACYCGLPYIFGCYML